MNGLYQLVLHNTTITDNQLIAVCDDGSVWTLDTSAADFVWAKYPDIPSPDKSWSKTDDPREYDH